jgi:hypothetical protein
MYARSSTVHGNPRSVDAAAAYLRDKLMPAVMGLGGFVGLSMMADRDSGRCIATTSWADEAAMHDSEGPLHQLRARYGEILGGRPEVQEWEIAVVHRLRPAPEGACTRVIWMQTEPANVDNGMETFRVSLLSRMEDLPGFCSISILMDREAGRAVSSTVYESRAAMDEAVGMATPMREGFSRQMGVEITEVAEFDLVLAHLRVPETV